MNEEREAVYPIAGGGGKKNVRGIWEINAGRREEREKARKKDRESERGEGEKMCEGRMRKKRRNFARGMEESRKEFGGGGTEEGRMGEGCVGECVCVSQGGMCFYPPILFLGTVRDVHKGGKMCV